MSRANITMIQSIYEAIAHGNFETAMQARSEAFLLALQYPVLDGMQVGQSEMRDRIKFAKRRSISA
jgi:hypothetical protein